MNKFTEYIGSQFGNPRGMIGKICCVLMNILNKAMYRRVISLIHVSEGEKVLDVGYGNGYLLKLLDSKVKVDLYGIDISEDMQIQAKKRNRKADADGRLHLLVGDCCNRIFGNGQFAAVTSINTVYFWSDTLTGLLEIRRILKSGGKFYNVIYTKEWLDTLSYTKKGFKKFEPEQLVELGKQAGFSNIEVQEIGKGKSFAVIYQK